MNLKTVLPWLAPLAVVVGGIIAVVVVLLLVSGDDDPLEPEEALPRMVLAPEDVGEPYLEDSTVTTTNEELALGDEDELAKLEDWGRILGYSVAIGRGSANEVEFPIFGVESAAALFESADGASESFAEDVEEARDTDWGEVLGFGDDTETREIDRSFSDETFWLRVSAVVLLGEEQTPVLVIDDQIVLREGDARGYLRVSSAFEGSDDREMLMDEVAALAEEQARLMRDTVD